MSPISIQLAASPTYKNSKPTLSFSITTFLSSKIIANNTKLIHRKTLPVSYPGLINDLTTEIF